jgi:hypothetical protein
MKKLINKAGLGLTALSGAAVVSVLSIEPALAQIRDGVNSANPGTGPTSIDSVITDVINVALWAIGILSVIMLIFGGIRYTVSGGDSNKVTAAKNTILYAVIGIVVAMLAYAIVNFVLTELGG